MTAIFINRKRKRETHEAAMLEPPGIGYKVRGHADNHHREKNCEASAGMHCGIGAGRKLALVARRRILGGKSVFRGLH